MFKKLMILPLTLAAFTVNAAKAEPAKNFKEVAAALGHGHKLHAVINLEKCETNAAHPVNMIASVHPEKALLIRGEKVTFANTHFTTHHPRHQGMPVFQHTKYVLNKDNSFTIYVDALNPQTYETIGEGMKAKCELNQGVYIYSGR